MKKQSQWNLTFRYLVGSFYFLVLIVFLIYARVAVRNLVIAAFIAYLINPAVVYLAACTKLSRFQAVNIVYFSSLILLVGLPATLAPIFYDEVQIVVQDVLDISSQLSATLLEPVRFGNVILHLEEWGRSLAQIQGDILAPLPEEALRWLETTSLGFLWFIVILVSVYLFLSSWSDMRAKLFSWFLPPYRAEMEELYNRVKRVWMAYLRGQIVLMIIVGVVFTIAWLAIGIPGAFVLGLLAGLFTLVPDVGPFLAALIATGVALLEGSTWIQLPNVWVAVITFSIYLVLIALKNFFLRPRIMGRSVHMHEGLVFIIIMIATILEGILGALLVVPVVASVVVISGYLRRRILGLPPFEDDESQQFVAPLMEVDPHLKVRRARRQKNLQRVNASDLPERGDPTRPTAKRARRKSNQ